MTETVINGWTNKIKAGMCDGLPDSCKGWKYFNSLK